MAENNVFKNKNPQKTTLVLYLYRKSVRNSYISHCHDHRFALTQTVSNFQQDPDTA